MYNVKEKINSNWELYIEENSVCREYTGEIFDKASLKAHGLASIPATVPGNFELDMLNAGLIDDPYYATNCFDVQKLENRHLWYSCSFEYCGTAPERAFLLFEGIDTFADIYLNGTLLGSTDNMFISHEFKARGIVKGKNELLIHIKPAVIEARKYSYDMDVFTHLRYNGGSLSTRKAAHMFGWDIMPRFVSAGIWRDVFLIEKKDNFIKDFYLQTTSLDGDIAELSACYNLELFGDYSTNYSLTVSGSCGESVFRHTLDKLWSNNGNITFTVNGPKLWWPRDMGEQNLYKVKIELFYKGSIVDTELFDFGIRTITLNRTDATDEDGNGEFCFIVNGQRLFVRGTNWVPMDAFHSRDAQRLDKALEMLKDVNCNMVRCWGGNVYEDHPFFDFCDKNGILVWQDFAMGCATYPQDDDFANRLKIEIEHVVKKLRRHTSIAIWAGDNECDVAAAFWSGGPKRNPANNRLTRKVIPELLSGIDPWRDFLPSSPYVSEKAYMLNDERILPENHLWGPRDYFKGEFYTKSPAYFASETGYHGCPSPESVKKFISPEKLWPWKNNDEWQAHATCMELGDDVPYAFRNNLMESQIKVLFGTEPQNLEDFSLLSQLSQAEADKFFIESFRSAKWRKTGIIWWNLVDGWPQFSDAVVDYYYCKKIAYYVIKRSQEPVCLIMRESENNTLSLVGVNEFLNEKSVEFKVTDLSENSVICDGNAVIDANNLNIIATVPYDSVNNHFYAIEWKCDGKTFKNHYVSGPVPYNYEKYLACMEKGGFLHKEGFGEN